MRKYFSLALSKLHWRAPIPENSWCAKSGITASTTFVRGCFEAAWRASAPAQRRPSRFLLEERFQFYKIWSKFKINGSVEVLELCGDLWIFFQKQKKPNYWSHYCCTMFWLWNLSHQTFLQKLFSEIINNRCFILKNCQNFKWLQKHIWIIYI